MGKNVYASVKSYSQRGKLLSRADFQTLAESRDLDEFMTRIKIQYMVIQLMMFKNHILLRGSNQPLEDN